MSYIERPQDARNRRLRALAQRMVNALGDKARNPDRDTTLRQMAGAGMTTGDDRVDNDQAELVESHIRWLLSPQGPGA